MPTKVANMRRRRQKEGEEPKGFETLVRQLVAQTKHVPSLPSRPVCVDSEREEASPEVLFSCEVDGVRCVLARSDEATLDALSLSPREREIARMIAKGHPNKVIASVLDISVWTVSTHLRRIFAKLGVTSRAAMVTILFKRGLL